MADSISTIEVKNSFGNRITKGAVIVIALYITIFVVAYLGLSLLEGALEVVSARYFGFDHLFEKYDFHLVKVFTAVLALVVAQFGSHAIAVSLSGFVPAGRSVRAFVVRSLTRTLYRFSVSVACSVFVVAFNLLAYQIETPVLHQFISPSGHALVSACTWPNGWIDWARMHRVSDSLGNPCHPITKEDVQKILWQEEVAQHANDLRAQQEEEQRRQKQSKADAENVENQKREDAFFEKNKGTVELWQQKPSRAACACRSTAADQQEGEDDSAGAEQPQVIVNTIEVNGTTTATYNSAGVTVTNITPKPTANFARDGDGHPTRPIGSRTGCYYFKYCPT